MRCRLPSYRFLPKPQQQILLACHCHPNPIALCSPPAVEVTCLVEHLSPRVLVVLSHQYFITSPSLTAPICYLLSFALEKDLLEAHLRGCPAGRLLGDNVLVVCEHRERREYPAQAPPCHLVNPGLGSRSEYSQCQLC